MRETFMTHILAADRKFYEGPLESLIVPTNEGQYGILAKHRNVITATVPGVLKYKLPNEEFKTAAVSSGLVKIENGEVLICVISFFENLNTIFVFFIFLSIYYILTTILLIYRKYC